MVFAAGLLAVVSCQASLGDTSELAFLINESTQTLTIHVSMGRGEIGADGRRPLCRFDPKSAPIRIGSVVDAYARRRTGSWPSVELVDYDSEKCSATVVLPATSALLMFTNGTCSDYGKYAANAGLEPTIERLKITGADRDLSLEGFDVAKAFEPSRSDNTCKLVIR